MNKTLTRIIISLVIIFFFLPFLLFGTNSIIAIHDNLDQMIPYYKMFKDNALFFKFDVPTKAFFEMSTLYYGHANFSLTPMLYSFLNDFWAYTLNKYLSILISFISMYFLLKCIKLINPLLIILISLCYSILPVGPNLAIAVSTLPLIIAIFIHLISKNKFEWKILMLILYPFFSTFTMLGIFILLFWFLGLLIFWIKQRKINYNILIGFVLLCTAYFLVDLKLFYVMFILKTPLNRSVYTIFSGGFITQINLFFSTLVNYAANGYYHASSFQRKIIIPLAFIVSLPCLIILIRKCMAKSGTVIKRIKLALDENNKIVKYLFLIEFFVFIFCIMAAFYDSGILENFIKKFIPMLHGFQWSRVWIFNRVLWYIIFAFCLQLILEIESMALEINSSSYNRKLMFPSLFSKIIVTILVCLQIIYISFDQGWHTGTYNDQNNTWRNFAKTVVKRVIPDRNFSFAISYKEFFAVELFDKIKSDISYSDEKVAAFGYHPSVLMYNGFNCIDGYNNAYPLSYMQKFRTLIAPELEVNEWAREYYDTWGGRMYLFNSELGYQPTRDKETSPVKLNIDMNVFKNDFNGVYILSRAEISNYDDLGLDFVRSYYDGKSIYTIYLYKSGI